jgi:hypothetical protein
MQRWNKLQVQRQDAALPTTGLQGVHESVAVIIKLLSLLLLLSYSSPKLVNKWA